MICSIMKQKMFIRIYPYCYYMWLLLHKVHRSTYSLIILTQGSNKNWYNMNFGIWLVWWFIFFGDEYLLNHHKSFREWLIIPWTQGVIIHTKGRGSLIYFCLLCEMHQVSRSNNFFSWNIWNFFLININTCQCEERP